jgi:hypothetical protein
MPGPDDREAGVAAALAGNKNGLAQVPPLPELPFGITPDQIAWMRDQFKTAAQEAVAYGIEEGAKRVAEKYGTYATVNVVANCVTAAAAVGILVALIAMLAGDDKKE